LIRDSSDRIDGDHGLLQEKGTGTFILPSFEADRGAAE